MTGSKARLQSAMEFMVTYGWALIILAVVLATLYQLGVFNQHPPNLCALPADVGCISATMFPNGNVVVNIQQDTQYTITVNSIGCNNQGIPVNMISLSPQVAIPIGGNQTFSVPCYISGMPYNAPIGQYYKGYLIINYSDPTGFSHTIQGTLIETVQ